MMSRQPPSAFRFHQAKETFLTAIIWAFTGLLYAILFVFFAALAEYWDLPVNPLFMAGVLAGLFGALIYSSLRLAVLMAALVSPICIFYFIISPHPIRPRDLLLIVSVAGALIGALYGYFSKSSRVYRADAKTLAGFAAGWLVSIGYLIFSIYIDTAFMGAVVAVMCAFTGLLYAWLGPVFLRFYDDLLPPVGDGLMVGLGVSGFVALCFFMMIGSIDSSVAGPFFPVLERILEALPGSIAGGMLGAGLAGAVASLLWTDRQDL
jgi:hypothetical protein